MSYFNHYGYFADWVWCKLTCSTFFSDYLGCFQIKSNEEKFLSKTLASRIQYFKKNPVF